MFGDPERNGTTVILMAWALWTFFTARLGRAAMRHVSAKGAARWSGWNLDLWGRPAIRMVFVLLCGGLAGGMIMVELIGAPLR